MTRKTALNKAIQLLSKRKGTEEIIEKLQDLCEELPLVHWTDKSIRDRCDQFVEDEKRCPTSTDFKKKGMPPHPVIKLKYGMPLSEWLQKNYPTVNMTFEEKKEIYTKIFIKEYKKIKPRSAKQFDKEKIESKSWQTVASYHNVSSWRALIKKLELTFYFDMQKDHVPMTFKVIVKTDVPEFNDIQHQLFE